MKVYFYTCLEKVSYQSLNDLLDLTRVALFTPKLK